MSAAVLVLVKSFDFWWLILYTPTVLESSSVMYRKSPLVLNTEWRGPDPGGRLTVSPPRSKTTTWLELGSHLVLMSLEPHYRSRIAGPARDYQHNPPNICCVLRRSSLPLAFNVIADTYPIPVARLRA
ncbi:uncharacterized protein PITG_02350 [Phytophthora infestans T30-4]|uniref:Secreted protein n=1 Tax=Phytophthora infestans (strain T30-4) TaxID=403677 RepID=D0MW39_PHYIT|nr:uncharacterized protein PITG_02350 [Phytophthora infestans T30-4]EEY63852.1 hypothetical protein PITG_02350 [Phytophthora infestans T30-4]|eukprot:XP_002907288.1 hypothetical protein PITG_02350 [Phytophthora infestans T30-4]